MVRASLILGAFLIVAALLLGGRYSVTGQGAVVYIVDRFTGSVRFCSSGECTEATNPWAVVKQEPTGTSKDGPWTKYQQNPDPTGGFTKLPPQKSN
jgi:hypothetical protein